MLGYVLFHNEVNEFLISNKGKVMSWIPNIIGGTEKKTIYWNFMSYAKCFSLCSAYKEMLLLKISTSYMELRIYVLYGPPGWVALIYSFRRLQLEACIHLISFLFGNKQCRRPNDNDKLETI